MIPIEEMAREHDLEPADVIELFHDFLNHTQTVNVPEIRQGLTETDLQAVRNAAHSIKGAALNLKLSEVARLAQAIEQKSAAGDLTGLPELFAALTAQIERVAENLREYAP